MHTVLHLFKKTCSEEPVKKHTQMICANCSSRSFSRLKSGINSKYSAWEEGHQAWHSISSTLQCRHHQSKDVVSAVTLWIVDHYLFRNILACFYWTEMFRLCSAEKGQRTVISLKPVFVIFNKGAEPCSRSKEPALGSKKCLCNWILD